MPRQNKLENAIENRNKPNVKISKLKNFLKRLFAEELFALRSNQ